MVIPPPEIRHPEDVETIRHVARKHRMDVGAAEAEYAWSKYSKDFYEAGWVTLSGGLEYDIVEALKRFLVPTEVEHPR